VAGAHSRIRVWLWPLRFRAILGELGEDYNLSKDGLLQVGLVVLALSPLIAARLRDLKR
jgi:hypothetical protein